MEFRLLGPVEAERSGDRVRLGGSRRPAVLATLLLRANHTVTVAELARGAWPRPPRAAESNLRTYLARLRLAFEEIGETTPRLITQPTGYQMTVFPGELDVAVFEDLVAQGQPAVPVPPSVAFDRLSRALRLWRGDPLAGLTDMGPLLEAEVDRLAERRLAVTELWAEAGLAAGHPDEVAAQLELLVRSHPLRERLWALLMRSLYRTGRRADALAAYREVYRIFGEELGIAPGSELQSLNERVLQADPDLDQLDEGAPTGVPVAAEGPAPRQLPAAPAPFVGRDRELARLDTALVEGGDARVAGPVVVVITGTAGVGKTALAVHWGHQVRDRFPDGQLYVNLRAYRPDGPIEPVQALGQLLLALGVAPDRIPTQEDGAAGLYRSLLADRRLFLLLDDAASAEQVRPLLPAVSGCTVLVTSRDKLTGLVALNGADQLPLDVLPAPEATGLLARLLGEERIGAEPAAAAALVRRCAHLPLALRIVAAHIADRRHQSIAESAAALESIDRWSALEVDGDRHNAVRAVFDMSYNRLEPATRRLFRLIGLPPGVDLTAQAAAALADITVDEAGQMLRRLADAHLAEEYRPGRYTVHELLRAYAAERVSVEDPEPARYSASDRLYGHYLTYAEAAAAKLSIQVTRLPAEAMHLGAVTMADIADHSQALDWLNGEHHNLIAIISHTATCGPRDVAWRLADRIRGYLWLRMSNVDWLVAARAALAAATADGNLAGQAAAQLSFALLYWRKDQYQPAIDHARRAVDLARQARWTLGLSAALGNLGTLYQRTGQLELAARHHREATTIDQRLGRIDGLAVDRTCLGAVLYDLGRLRRAADQFRRALRLYEKIGSSGGEIPVMLNLGITLGGLGHLDEAADRLNATLSLARKVEDRANEAIILVKLAEVHRDAGRHTEALHLTDSALAIAHDIGNRRTEADALTIAGTVHSELGSHQLAVNHLTRALDLVGHTDDRYTETTIHIGLAEAWHRLGRHGQALAHAQRALDLARGCGYRVLEGRSLTGLAAVELAHRDLDRAGRHADEALTIHRETGHRLGRARTHVLLATIRQATGATVDARNHQRRALAAFTAIGAALPARE